MNRMELISALDLEPHEQESPQSYVERTLRTLEAELVEPYGLAARIPVETTAALDHVLREQFNRETREELADILARIRRELHERFHIHSTSWRLILFAVAQALRDIVNSIRERRIDRRPLEPREILGKRIQVATAFAYTITEARRALHEVE